MLDLNKSIVSFEMDERENKKMTTKKNTLTLGEKYHKYKTIDELKKKGQRNSDIARLLNISRNDVHRVVLRLLWYREDDENIFQRWKKMEWAFDLSLGLIGKIEEFSYQSIHNKPRYRNGRKIQVSTKYDVTSQDIKDAITNGDFHPDKFYALGRKSYETICKQLDIKPLDSQKELKKYLPKTIEFYIRVLESQGYNVTKEGVSFSSKLTTKVIR